MDALPSLLGLALFWRKCFGLLYDRLWVQLCSSLWSCIWEYISHIHFTVLGSGRPGLTLLSTKVEKKKKKKNSLFPSLCFQSLSVKWKRFVLARTQMFSAIQISLVTTQMSARSPSSIATASIRWTSSPTRLTRPISGSQASPVSSRAGNRIVSAMY